jgi:hypothetical protein
VDPLRPDELRFTDDPMGWLDIYEEPQPNASYVIGVDPAEGLDKGDFQALTVLKRPRFPGEELEQVAECLAHEESHDFSSMVFAVSVWYNTAWLGVENNHDFGVCNRLIKDYRYPRMFYMFNQEVANPSQPRKPGFTTSVKNRRDVVNALIELLDTRMLVIRSLKTSEQLDSFVYDKHGKSGARGTKHDDAISALGIAVQMHFHCPLPQFSTAQEKMLEEYRNQPGIAQRFVAGIAKPKEKRNEALVNICLH